MPELPEVEVSRLGISPHLEGQLVDRVVLRTPALRWPIPADVLDLAGQRIESIERRAKYLLLHTAVGTAILHLGMSGKLRVVPANTPPIKHDHVDIVLSNQRCLRFNDPRRFGAFLWQPVGETHPLLLALGPEPLSDDFDGQHLFARSRKKSVAVKNFIMDNHNVVGVGNIYANESLFKAGISPHRKAGQVSLARYVLLAEKIKQTLAIAIEQGGTTLKDFTQVDGKPGYFAQSLLVYGRGGELCLQCQTKLKESKLGQRTTVYCPNCQK